MGRDFGALYLLGAMTQLCFSFKNNGWDSLLCLILPHTPLPHYKIIDAVCQELENQKSQKKKIPP